MLPLASFLLAALLGQSSLSSSDPLPCVAAQVPGCVAGYVRDPNYVPPLAQTGPVPLRPLPSEVPAPAAPASWASTEPASWAYPIASAPPPAAVQRERASRWRIHRSRQDRRAVLQVRPARRLLLAAIPRGRRRGRVDQSRSAVAGGGQRLRGRRPVPGARLLLERRGEAALLHVRQPRSGRRAWPY